ncbi:hypothetical protein ACFY36_50570 [Actinoplanes sp. NPDC000266]
MAGFDFELPDDAPADMTALAQLAASVATLTAAVESLHQQHLDLRDTVTRQQQRSSGGPRKAPDAMPWPLRWTELDRDAAAGAWAWLIGWVDWFVDRYQLAEEIPACWYQHPPLVEELTALAAAWHACYGDDALADGPLLWHERLARARERLRGWDDATRCRNGEHTARQVELAWPDDWQDTAIETANTDLGHRTTPPATGAEPAREDRP